MVKRHLLCERCKYRKISFIFFFILFSSFFLDFFDCIGYLQSRNTRFTKWEYHIVVINIYNIYDNVVLPKCEKFFYFVLCICSLYYTVVVWRRGFFYFCFVLMLLIPRCRNNWQTTRHFPGH